MPLFFEGSAMMLIMRVEVWSSSSTAFSQIAKFMNVDTMLAVWIKTFHCAGYFDG